MDNFFVNSSINAITPTYLQSPQLTDGQENSAHVVIQKPTCLEEVFIAGEEPRRQINEIVSGVIPLPSLGTNGILLHGTYGTGKSLLAKLIPAAIEKNFELTTGKQPIVQISDADMNWFDCDAQRAQDVLSQLRQRIQYRSLNASSLHYVILDEVDHFQSKVMKTLRGLMSGTDRTIFILTTNDLNKIDKGVRNRCVEIEIGAAEPYQLTTLVNTLSIGNKPGLPQPILDQVVADSHGSIRKLVHLLQAEINRSCGGAL